jgi:hypothetical protein
MAAYVLTRELSHCHGSVAERGRALLGPAWRTPSNSAAMTVAATVPEFASPPISAAVQSLRFPGFEPPQRLPRAADATSPE